MAGNVHPAWPSDEAIAAELGRRAAIRKWRCKPLESPKTKSEKAEAPNSELAAQASVRGEPPQISLIPLSEACPSRPMMMWSWTETPRLLATAMISWVILMSWVDGVGSPEG